jgi:hypothetical protein
MHKLGNTVRTFDVHRCMGQCHTPTVYQDRTSEGSAQLLNPFHHYLPHQFSSQIIIATSGYALRHDRCGHSFINQAKHTPYGCFGSFSFAFRSTTGSLVLQHRSSDCCSWGIGQARSYSWMVWARSMDYIRSYDTRCSGAHAPLSMAHRNCTHMVMELTRMRALSMRRQLRWRRFGPISVCPVQRLRPNLP